jgi:hypothetical protein
MIYKKSLIFIFVIVFYMNLYSEEDDEFNFFTENIAENQLKTIEIVLPYVSKHGDSSREYHYVIKIGNDGIIRSIVQANDNSRFAYIYRKNNLLNIRAYDQRPFINNIKWDNNNVYVRGITAYNPANDEFVLMRVNLPNNVIFESYIIKLLKTSNATLKEINSYGGQALSYSNNVTESFYSSLDSRIIYKYMTNEIIGIYYGGMEGEDIYSPPIRIINDGNIKLYSENQAINVINYQILNSCSGYSMLANVLFPLLFLENPFARNNWRYTASSFLREGNTEYDPNNLSSIGGLPWASANGQGIGDKITINTGVTPNDSIIIINGFVAKDRPHLFSANSRVKQIRITNLNNRQSMIRTIEDLQTPQIISLRNLNPSQNMRLEIEILSVYPGARYNDLCIQAIF